MRTLNRFFSANRAFPPDTLRLRLAVSGAICALLTSAMVLGQDAKPAPAPAPAPMTFKAVMKKGDAKDLKKVEGKVKIAAPKGVVRRQAGLDANVNFNPMVQQFTQQGRPLVIGELLFVRHICNLTPDQLRPISRDTSQTLKDVAKKMVDDQQNGMRIRVRGNANTTPDAGKQLQDALALVIKKHLTPEQYARYRSEFDKRSANRKQAALSFLIDALDRDLVLSSQQREKLTESISAHWDDGWCMYVEYILHGNQFYPNDLHQYVMPLLNDNQKKVWQGVQRVSGFWGFVNTMGGMINDGDPLLRELGLEEKDEPKSAEGLKELRLNGGGGLLKVQMKAGVRAEKIEGKKELSTKK